MKEHTHWFQLIQATAAGFAAYNTHVKFDLFGTKENGTFSYTIDCIQFDVLPWSTHFNRYIGRAISLNFATKRKL